MTESMTERLMLAKYPLSR